jgi:thiamine-monophosphate kinase
VNETARIALIARILAATRSGTDGVELGIGDDAAVLRSPGGAASRMVWTIDEQVEGVHFRRDLATWRDVGWRSFQAAASDVAAMGGKPWCALCALVLPDSVDDVALEEITCGQRDAALAVGAPIVGGNLSRGAGFSIATSLLGTCEGAVTRAGAKPGDGLWMAGRVGLAACGLRALRALAASAPGGVIDEEVEPAVEAWRRPTALVREGLAMAEVAHAAVDVSDGLVRDVGHMAEASGVAVALDASELLSDAVLMRAAARVAVDPLDLALYGGEDYALVAASPLPIVGFRRIGIIREGAGLVLRTAAGDTPLLVRGFDHFAR